ncbi:MAG: ATP-dependent DNA helicase RecG [Flavobacteriaceae bacterium]|nr:ATP-dependent DNA helicase RecG [Flavobacteriaceae bacterium]
MKTHTTHTALAYLKGVGPARAELFEKELGIKTIGDLVSFFPNRYIDRTQFYKIGALQETQADVQIVGKITNIITEGELRHSRLKATFTDETGSMELVWFKGIKWIKSALKTQTPYVIFGRINLFKGVFSMAHPEMDLLTEFQKSLQSAMQPVYPSTENLLKKGISNRVVQGIMQNLFLEFKGAFQETLSRELLQTHQLIDKNTALFQLHFPENQSLLAQAEYRMKFEELFYIQLQLLRNNLLRKRKIKSFIFEKVGFFFNEFYEKHLPFDLTEAQKRVLREIRKDMAFGAQMNRLLQGDVGSGKTIVAVLAALIALDNGFQVAIMAPTEILATQHFLSISELLKDMPVQIRLLTGSVKTKDRKIIHEHLENGSLHVLIGTHALIEDKVKFQNLGLVVIDEQHRFGVAQRAKMWQKNHLPPHVLVMTATPIPRTLAMTLYGDLDVSVIDELPPGRKEIKTALRFDSQRLSVFQFLKEEIAKGRQIYIVYPLIEESETLDYKYLMDGYESIIRAFPRPNYQVGIVHGRMKPADKDAEMQLFTAGKTHILVATTVIEVGVNVPNASVMLIENPEKFGLSQLHQLRGRVGRGADQSYCVLLAGTKLTHEAKMRLKTMVETNDGFKIAEVDLKLRGPGNIMGTQQSGILNLKIADIVRDSALLKMARYAAMDILKEDPNLEATKNYPIRITYSDIDLKTGIWANIS